MSLRTVRCDAASLAPWVPQLRALEAAIEYPLDDGNDRFTLDHGQSYHGFFSAMGESHFGLTLDAGRVVASLAAVEKRVVLTGHPPVRALYLGDFKAAPTHRGGVGTRPLVARALRELVFDRRLRQTRLLFGAAMRGARGDVMRSAVGAHPARLFAPWATLSLFFVGRAAWSRVRPRALTCAAGPGLDLSPDAPEGLVSTEGVKSYRLRSTGASWPLRHLVVRPETPDYAEALVRLGLGLGDDEVGCFGLDLRCVDAHQWLASQGVRAGAVCTVYALGWLPSRPAWVNLATSEI